MERVNDVQMLQREHEHVGIELAALRKKYEIVKENQQKILHRIQKLESRVEAATIRRVTKPSSSRDEKSQAENKRIIMELVELKNKMAKMENENQREKDERIQEITRQREKETEMLRKHEEVRENQQRILYQTKNLESRVENIKASSVRGEKSISSQQDKRWHQEREHMIQQFKDERDSENAKLKQLMESEKSESTDKIQKLQDNIKDMDQRIIKLETPGKHTKNCTSNKKKEKRCGRMLDIDYSKIQTNFMYLMKNIQEPTRLCLSLFSCGVFDDDDVEKIKKCLRDGTERDATEMLLFKVLQSGENAYQAFLECLAEVGYNQVIERLERTEEESSNQHRDDPRLIEEKGALIERSNEKIVKLQELAREREHDVQMLQREHKRINMELVELRNKMTKMENAKEKDERVQEINLLKERENELRKKHEEVRETQQRNIDNIKNLRSCVEDLKAATISRDYELPRLEPDTTHLFTLLQKTATAEEESTNLEDKENFEEYEITETLDACSRGNGQQQIHPAIGTVADLGSTVEANLGCNTDEKQYAIPKTLDCACLEGDLNKLKGLIESGHDINERYEGGMTPILICSKSQIEPVSKIKMILDKGGKINDSDTYNNNMLHLACEYGSLETIAYLLGSGLDVQSKGFYGETPILLCSQSQIEPVSKMKLILDEGGNINDRDKYSNSILHIACKYGRLITVQYLLGMGSDVMSINRLGKTPVDCCRGPFVSESDEKIKLLEKKLTLVTVLPFYSPS